MPITIVYKLNAPVQKKISLCVLMGMGVFAGVCAILKALQFNSALSGPDPSYSSYSLYLWAALGSSFLIVAGSVPPSKPLWDKVFKGQPIVGAAGEHQASGLRDWSFWSSLSSIRNVLRGSRGSATNLTSYDSGDSPSQNSNETYEPKSEIQMHKTVTVEQTEKDGSSLSRSLYGNAGWTTDSAERHGNV